MYIRKRCARLKDDSLQSDENYKFRRNRYSKIKCSKQIEMDPIILQIYSIIYNTKEEKETCFSTVDDIMLEEQKISEESIKKQKQVGWNN
jgi:hypothetical protein